MLKEDFIMLYENDELYLKAKNEYDEKRYDEAYSAFLLSEQSSPDNYNTTFYKGLCAGYMSTKENLRLTELQASVIQSIKLADNKKEYNAAAATFSSELYEFIKWYVNVFCISAAPIGGTSNPFESQSAINTYCMTVLSILPIAEYSCAMITDEIIKENGYNEKIKAERIEFSLNLCSQVVAEYQYDAGTKEVKSSNGYKVVTEFKKASADKQVKKSALNYKEKFVSMYNSLPTIVAELKNINSEIEQKQYIIDDYNLALSNYFDKTGKDKKSYSKSLTKPLLTVTCILISAAIIMFLIWKIKIVDLFMWLAILLAALGLCLLVFTIIKAIIRSSDNRKIRKAFPDELKAKKESSKNAEKELKKSELKKAKFIEEKIKK